MGHKDDRGERHQQSAIERRRVKPGPSRVTRSRSRSKNGTDLTDVSASAGMSSSATGNGHTDIGDGLLEEFRARAKRAAALHMWPSSAFFAEKAAAVSRSPEDFLFLARVHQGAGDTNRAFRVVTANKLEKSTAAGRLIAAQCLLERGKSMESLELLGDEDPPSVAATAEQKAALCVMRARVHAALDNPGKVEVWCRRALEADPHCVEAFLTLTQPGLLSREAAGKLAQEVSSSAAILDSATSNRRSALPALYLSLGDATASFDKLPSSLARSSDVAAARAARHYLAFEYSACADVCKELIRNDAGVGREVILTYLASLVELSERQELFVYAHKLVDAEPRDAVTWLAVGYYYLVSGVYDTARLYLQKSSALDPRLVQAWVAIGHAYAAKDESEHAMTAYSTAARLNPGSHLPMLFMGMQHARQSSVGLASRLFWTAAEADAADPAPRHELGVVAYRKGDIRRAVEYFQAALALWKRPIMGADVRNPNSAVGRKAEAEEATLVNLGHCFRRLEEFDRAKSCYERALSLYPNCPQTVVALALTLHSMKHFELAVAMYHRALRQIPDDAICNELLEKALKDLIEEGE